MLKSERDYYPIIGRFFESRGYKVFYDYPINSRLPLKVDVLLFKENNGDFEVISIEVKRSNWSKVFYQAIQRLVFSQYVYVAFPCDYLESRRSKIMSKAKTLGLGVICVSDNGEVQVLLEPKLSMIFSEEIARSYLKEILTLELKL